MMIGTLLGVGIGSIVPTVQTRWAVGDTPHRVRRQGGRAGVARQAAILHSKSLSEALKAAQDQFGWGAYRSVDNDRDLPSKAETVWMRLLLVLAGAMGGSMPGAERWIDWLDAPAEALSGLTPFQAARIDEGFELLVGWIGSSGCKGLTEGSAEERRFFYFMLSKGLIENAVCGEHIAQSLLELMGAFDRRRLAIREIVSCRPVPDSGNRPLLEILIKEGEKDFFEAFKRLLATTRRKSVSKVRIKRQRTR